MAISEVQQLASHVKRGEYSETFRLASRRLVIQVDNSKSGSGRTALIIAANISGQDSSWQYAKCIEYLLHLGADPGAVDRHGDTAAHLAARKNNHRLLALLPFDAKYKKNAVGMTPLMEAVQSDSESCVKHLLHLFRQSYYFDDKRHLLVEAKNNEGLTAMEIARNRGRHQLVPIVERELRITIHGDEIFGLTREESEIAKRLRKAAKRCNISDLRQLANFDNSDLPVLPNGSTAVMVAAAAGVGQSREVIQVLVQECGADPTCARVSGFTSLHVAACSSHPSGIKALVHLGASANARVPGTGHTPLTLAASHGWEKNVSALLQLGANWELKCRREGCEERSAIELANRTCVIDILNSYTNEIFFSDRSDSHSEEYYRVTSPQGFCLIINVEKYDAVSGLPDRLGSGKDLERVQKLFGQQLDFRVHTLTDCTAEEMNNFLSRFAMSDELGKHGCLFCFIMAHGAENVVYGKDGQTLDISHVTTKFQPNLCAKLENKPKIFIIQACRHDLERLPPKTSNKMDPDAVTVSNPNLPALHSDFLIFHPNVRGHPAFRNTLDGSPFIQTLCEEMESKYEMADLVNILASVTRVVSRISIQLDRDGQAVYDRSVPQAISQLTKKVALHPLPTVPAQPRQNRTGHKRTDPCTRVCAVL